MSTKMVHPQSDPGIVPEPFEIAKGVVEWEQEFARIRTHYDALKQADLAAFNAEKDAIVVSVKDKREEQIRKLNAEIHQYMISVQEDMDNLLAELQSEKLHRLDTEFKERQEEREKVENQHLLEHYRKFKTISSLASTRDQPRIAQEPARTEEVQAARASSRSTASVDKGQQRPKGEDVIIAAQPQAVVAEKPQPQVTNDKTDMSGTPPRKQLLETVLDVSASKQPLTPDGPQSFSVEAERVVDPLSRKHQGKRKAAEGAEAEHYDTSKRAKVQVSEIIYQSDSPEQDSTASMAPQPRSSNAPSEKRTIPFDEVYQGGNAKYKHIIVEFPPDSQRWFILKCDEHEVHFGLKPLLGAAKHLSSIQHSNLQKRHSLAIDLLGHRVWDCNSLLAAKNNAAVQKAFDNGYVAFNMNRLTKQDKIRQGYTVPGLTNGQKIADGPVEEHAGASAAAQKSPRLFAGISDPVPGELYLGYWSKTKTKYAIMVCPFWGDISVTGLPGDLASIGLVANAPKCVRVRKSTQEILGWAREYEDGGALVSKREFPVVYFDRKHQVGWLPAKHISRFDFDDPNADQIPEYHKARDRYAVLRNFPSYEAMKKERGVPPYVNAKAQSLFPSPSASDAFSTERDDSVDPGNETQPGVGSRASTIAHPVGPSQPGHGKQAPEAASNNNLSDEEMGDNAAAGGGNATEPYLESDGDESEEQDDDDVVMEEAGNHNEITAPSSRGSPKDDIITSQEKQPLMHAPPNHDSVESNSLAVENRKPSTAQNASSGGDSNGVTLPALESTRSAAAQEIAAQALHLSPEREVVSPRLEQNATSLQTVSSPQTSHITTSIVAKPNGTPEDPVTSEQLSHTTREIRATGSRQDPVRRISNLQDILGADISPIRHRGDAVDAEILNGITTSKSVSPTTRTEKFALPPRPPSAQPLNSGAHSLPPKPPAPNGSSNNSRSPSLNSEKPREAFNGINGPDYRASPSSGAAPGDLGRQSLPNGKVNGQIPENASQRPSPRVEPATVEGAQKNPAANQNETSQNWNAVAANAAAVRSGSSTPAPGSVSDPVSRKSTPTILRGDTIEKWKAIRNASYSASPQQAFATIPNAQQAGVPSPKEARFKGVSPVSTSGQSIHADPAADKGQDFDIVSYHGDNRRWLREDKGPYLRLSVDVARRIAEAGAGEVLHVTVDPQRVASMVLEPLDASGTTAVELFMKEGAGSNRQRLVFATKDSGPRLESGKVQARRFCQWVKAVNPSIGFRPTSNIDAPRRFNSATTRETVVIVD